MRWVRCVHALAASGAVVLAPRSVVTLPAMLVAGWRWISTANSLTVAAQLALPDWVRARGMSIYQMALMGGAAAGAALWGQVAVGLEVRGTVLAAAAFGVADGAGDAPHVASIGDNAR